LHNILNGFGKGGQMLKYDMIGIKGGILLAKPR